MSQPLYKDDKFDMNLPENKVGEKGNGRPKRPYFFVRKQISYEDWGTKISVI